MKSPHPSSLCFERAVPRHEYAWSTRLVDRRAAADPDWYYVRVRQRDDQWAWSSSSWVGTRSIIWPG